MMQTFHSSTAVSSTPSSHLDAVVLGAPPVQRATTPDMPMIPIMPDNYTYNATAAAAAAAAASSSAAASKAGPTIVAADPDRVMPSTPLSGVEAAGLDHVELKFVHSPQAPVEESGMLRDLWKGMVDDIFGEAPKAAK